MACYYIHIEFSYNNEQLKKVFAKILNLSEQDFYLINGFIGDYFDENGNFTLDYEDNDSRYLCERYDKDGDFKTYIELGFPEELNWPSRLEFAKKLSKELGCKCLISPKNELNPYHWLLVNNTGIVEDIFVDRKSDDERGELIIDCLVKDYVGPDGQKYKL